MKNEKKHDPTLLKEISDSQAEVSDLKKERGVREKFVSTLSHDIRSPLAVARLSAEVLLKNPKDLRKHVEKIIKAIDRADAMIIDLLDANKMASDSTLDLVISECHLKKIAQEVVDNFLLNQMFNISVTGESIRGHWDAELIRRVIENLVSNAIKYGDNDKTIEVSVGKKNDCAIVKVHNYGNPIDPKIQKLLFQHHQRGEQLQGKKGWGIGLAMVKNFVDILGGKISLTSSESEGTVFEVSLPLG